MLRYGKKLDRCYNDKLGRSNRGRARTSATAEDRKHVNRGYGRASQIVVIRADKKRDRLAARIEIEIDLFNLELSKSDPEIWLHGTDLTTFEDTVTRPHRGYPSQFTADPYGYVPDAFDWDWEYQDDLYQDDEGEFHHLHAGDYESDPDWMNSGWGPDPDPEPTDAAWRDLWVAGRADDPEGRDQFDPWHRHGLDWDLDYYDPYDLENPLLEREDPAPPATIEAIVERNLERHRAGERYFRQTGRTVFKPPAVYWRKTA